MAVINTYPVLTSIQNTDYIPITVPSVRSGVPAGVYLVTPTTLASAISPLVTETDPTVSNWAKISNFDLIPRGKIPCPVCDFSVEITSGDANDLFTRSQVGVDEIFILDTSVHPTPTNFPTGFPSDSVVFMYSFAHQSPVTSVDLYLFPEKGTNYYKRNKNVTTDTLGAWQTIDKEIGGSGSGLPADGTTGDALFRNTGITDGSEWLNPVITQFPRNTLIEGLYRTSVTQRQIPFGVSRSFGEIDQESTAPSSDYVYNSIIPLEGRRCLIVNSYFETNSRKAQVASFNADLTSATIADATYSTGVTLPDFALATYLYGWVMPNGKTVILQRGSSKVWILSINASNEITEFKESSVSLPAINNSGCYGRVVSSGELVVAQTISSGNTVMSRLIVGDTAESIVTSGPANHSSSYNLNGSSPFAGGGTVFEDATHYYAGTVNSNDYFVVIKIGKDFTTTDNAEYSRHNFGFGDIIDFSFASCGILNGNLLCAIQDDADNFSVEQISLQNIASKFTSNGDLTNFGEEISELFGNNTIIYSMTLFPFNGSVLWLKQGASPDYLNSLEFVPVTGDVQTVITRALTNAWPDAYNQDQTVTIDGDFAGVWDNVTTYNIGQVVLEAGKFYRALIQNTNSQPTDSNTDWSSGGGGSSDNGFSLPEDAESLNKRLSFGAGQATITYSDGQKTISWDDDISFEGLQVILQGKNGNRVFGRAGSPVTTYVLKLNNQEVPFEMNFFTNITNITLSTPRDYPELPANISLVFNGDTHTLEAHADEENIRKYTFIPQTRIPLATDFTLDITGTGIAFGEDVETNVGIAQVSEENLGQRLSKYIVQPPNDMGVLEAANATNINELGLTVEGNIRVGAKEVEGGDTSDRVTYREITTADLRQGERWLGEFPNRPTAPQDLDVYFNTTDSEFEIYSAIGWFPKDPPTPWLGAWDTKAQADHVVSVVGDKVFYGGRVRVVTAFVPAQEENLRYLWNRQPEVSEIFRRVSDLESAIIGETSTYGYIKGRLLGERSTNLTLPGGSSPASVSTGITVENSSEIDFIYMSLASANDFFETVWWAAIRDLDPTVAGQPFASDAFMSVEYFSTTNRVLRIGRTATDEILLSVLPGNQTLTISPFRVLTKIAPIAAIGSETPDDTSFDIAELPTGVLSENSEFAFNDRIPVRQHLLYSENQSVEFQRDGGTDNYDVNLPPPDAPRREGTEWGEADSKISDVLWSGRFADSFLSLDLRSAGEEDPQTLMWRDVGSVGERTAVFVNPPGFDKAEVNFFTDGLSSPQSWRRHFFIDIIQSASSHPLTPAFLLAHVGTSGAGTLTVGDVGSGYYGISQGAGVQSVVGNLSGGSLDPARTGSFTLVWNSTGGWVIRDTSSWKEIANISINDMDFDVSSRNGSAAGAYTWISFPSAAPWASITSGDVSLQITYEDGTTEFVVTTIERIPLSPNDPSGHNTQQSLWWSEDPADENFSLADLNARAFDIEFTNGSVLYTKPTPHTLFTSTDISTLNNNALVTLDKINRVNTSANGNDLTFYLQGHKRVHNGADYLRLTLFNDEELSDQAGRSDINPDFAPSTGTSVDFNFRLDDIPASNELRKSDLRSVALEVSNFATPIQNFLQREISGLNLLTSGLSVTGQRTYTSELLEDSLALVHSIPSGGRVIDTSSILASGSLTVQSSEQIGANFVYSGGIVGDFNSFSSDSDGVWFNVSQTAITSQKYILSGTNEFTFDKIRIGSQTFLPGPYGSRPYTEGVATNTAYIVFWTDEDTPRPVTLAEMNAVLAEAGAGNELAISFLISGDPTSEIEELTFTDTVDISAEDTRDIILVKRPFIEDKDDLRFLLTELGQSTPEDVGRGNYLTPIASLDPLFSYYYYELSHNFLRDGKLSVEKQSVSFADTLYEGKARINRGPTLPSASEDWLPREIFSLTNPQGPFSSETDVTFTQLAANIIGVENPFTGSDIFRIAFTETTKGGWVQTDGLDSAEVNSWTHIVLGNSSYALSPGVLTVDGNTLKQVIGEDGDLITGEASPFNSISVGDTVRASIRKRDGSYVGGATPSFEVRRYERQDTISTDLKDVWHPLALVHADHEDILRILENHFRKDRDIHDAKLFLNHTRGWSDGLSGLDNVPDDFPSAIHSITWHNDISDTNRYRRFVIEVTEDASDRSYHEKTFVYRGTEHELFYYTRNGNNNRYRTAANSQTSDPGSPWRRVNLENVSYEVHEVFTGSRAWLFHKGDN